MKSFSENNIEFPFLTFLPKYEHKQIFCENLSFFYKLSIILYFALDSKFLTFMKELEGFLITGWMVKQELVRAKSEKNNRPASYLISESPGEN